MILLVDDSRTHRSILRVYLTGKDVSFLEAGTGREGLEVLERSRVDIIIADINMPEMDGVDFIREVRRHQRPEIRRIPIVVLSGDSRMKEAEAAGADVCLVKPVSDAGVADTVDRLLRERRP